VWVVAVVVLGVCGAHKPEGIWVILARIGTLYYYLHFLVIMPILGRLERTLPLPDSISRPVMVGGGPVPSGATARPMEQA
jgi:ubiquinol-cytochrome c reductase cytochrome b subunit